MADTLLDPFTAAGPGGRSSRMSWKPSCETQRARRETTTMMLLTELRMWRCTCPHRRF